MSTHDLHRVALIYVMKLLFSVVGRLYTELSLGTDVQEFEQLYSAYVG